MDSGLLRYRVNILRSQGTLSDTGGVAVGSPVVVASSVPAAIESLPMQFQMREGRGAGAAVSQVSHIVRMRYREDVTTAMWLEEVGGRQRKFEAIQVLEPGVMDKIQPRTETHALCVERG